ncbi:MAG: hypothetical protein ABI196_07130 [Bradyrhizobium sp.]
MAAPYRKFRSDPISFVAAEIHRAGMGQQTAVTADALVYSNRVPLQQFVKICFYSMA